MNQWVLFIGSGWHVAFQVLEGYEIYTHRLVFSSDAFKKQILIIMLLVLSVIFGILAT